MQWRGWMSVEDFASDRALALGSMSVSRETTSCLDEFADLLNRWRLITDLISPATWLTLWTRHILDSAQLLKIEPNAKTWVDMGTGAGFPGLIVAVFLKGIPGAHVTLIESDKRKVAFLKEAVRITGAPATVRSGRLDKILPSLHIHPEVITARALAPLKILIRHSLPFLNHGTIALFPKGSNVSQELSDAGLIPDFCYDMIQSQTSDNGQIVRISRSL